MEDLSFADLLDIFRRRKLTIAKVTLSITAIAGVALCFMPKEYEGESTLLFPEQATGSISSQLTEATGISIAGLTGQLSGRDVYTMVLRSKSLSKSVSTKMELGRYDVELIDMQNNLTLQPTKEGGLIVKFDVPTSWLKNHVPGNELEQRTADLAAGITNAYVQELGEYDRSSNLSQGRKNRVFVEGQLARSKDDLVLAEERLRKFQEAHPTLPPPTNTQEFTGHLDELITRQTEAEVALRESEAQYDTALAAWRQKAPKTVSPAAVIDSPSISELRTRLSALEVKRATLSQSMTDNNPEMVSALDEIKSVRSKLSSEVAQVMTDREPSQNPAHQEMLKQLAALQVTKDGLRARLTGIQSLMDQMEKQLKGMPEEEIQYSRVLRDVEIAQSVYKTLVAEYSKAQIAEAKTSDNFVVLDAADVPEKPISPKIKLTMFASLILGLIIGVFTAVTKETASHTRIKSKPSPRKSEPVLVGNKNELGDR